MTVWYLNMNYLPVRELPTATGSRMFRFCCGFAPCHGQEKHIDDCGLTLQTRWRENAPKMDKFNFRFPSLAQKRLLVFGTPTWLVSFADALLARHAIFPPQRLRDEPKERLRGRLQHGSHVSANQE